MTETDARAVLLMRSCERAALVGADDVAWAAREARRQVGAAAEPGAWLARRAQLALGRLAERQPALRPALRTAQAPRLAAGAALLLAAALGFGLLGDGLGRSQTINLLALPLLGLLAWNLAVLLLLAMQALRPAAAGARPGTVATALARLGARLAQRWPGTGPLPAPAREALVGFATDWLQHSRPLQAARGGALLHACAALLGLGVVAALYARGLVFDYRAGWDSTFLQPGQVQQLLGWLLGPASALAGLPLPDAEGIARLAALSPDLLLRPGTRHGRLGARARDDEPQRSVAAVVASPLHGEVFTATLGDGARCNGRPIRCAEPASVAQGMTEELRETIADLMKAHEPRRRYAGMMSDVPVSSYDGSEVQRYRDGLTAAISEALRPAIRECLQNW